MDYHCPRKPNTSSSIHPFQAVLTLGRIPHERDVRMNPDFSHKNNENGQTRRYFREPKFAVARCTMEKSKGGLRAIPREPVQAPTHARDCEATEAKAQKPKAVKRAEQSRRPNKPHRAQQGSCLERTPQTRTTREV